jgi:hypothetical protein
MRTGVPWIILVLTAAIPVLLALLGWLAYRQRGWSVTRVRDEASAEPTCAACGYAVIGLPSHVCPECGSDLRVVGIRTPRAPDPRPLHVTLTVWLLIVMGVATLTWDFVRPRLPVRYGSFDRILLTPSSNAYRDVDVRAFGNGWSRQRLRTDVEVMITAHSGGRRHVYVRPGRPPVTYDTAGNIVNNTGPTTAPAAGEHVTPQAILNGMAAAGIDTTDPRVQTEAAELSRYVNDNLGPNGWGSLTGARGHERLAAWSGTTVWARNVTAQRPDWVLWCAGGAWLLVWLIGAAAIVARRRRSRRRRERARAAAVFLPASTG